MMRRFPGWAATSVVTALVVLFGGLESSARAARAPSLPACSADQLVPQVGATTVNQGVGSYATLTRAKDTLVRFFLVYQPAVGTTCSGTTSIRGASLMVGNGGASYGPIAAHQSFGSSGTAISSTTVAVDSNADPKFVVPAARVNSCLADLTAAPCDDSAAGFSLTFTASVTYTTSASSTALTTALPVTATGAFDKSTNALRVLVIPMGDSSQPYSTQLTDSGRAAISNGFAALSRILPVASGVSSTLTATTGGIRYKLDLAAMLNLKAVAGAYDPNGKFCGSQSNFDAIKGQLATFLAAYNASITDPAQRADRVLGVVDQAISDGSTSAYNCAEGMASTNSPEAWVRAIPDRPASGKNPPVPSMTGPLMAMEFAHTYGLDDTLSFHSPNTQADLTSPDRAYNVSSRSWVSDDRSALRFVASSPFDNNNAFLELDEFARMLSCFGGSSTGCLTTQTGTVVAAGTTFAIGGTTDFTPAGTTVVESFASDNDPVFAPDPASDLKLRLTPLSGPLVEIGVPYSTKSSEHLAATGLNTTNAVFGGVFQSPGGIQKVELVYNGTVLYARDAAATPPQPAGFSGLPPGATISIDKVVPTTAIPPKVDICLVQDETGSFSDDITMLNRLTAGTLIPALDATRSDYATCVVGFRDFAQNGWGLAGDWVYKRYADVTAAGGGFSAGVPQLTATSGAGNDGPEAQLEALHYLATPSHPAINSNGNVDPDAGPITTDPEDTPAGLQPTWRAGAKRVVLLATDNACHVKGDAGGWPGDEGTASASTTAGTLSGAGITLIGLVPTVQGADPCVNTLASETGGTVHAIGADSATIVSAIMAGLGNLPVTVTPSPTCDAGLSLLFDGEPAAVASKTVESGTDVTWDETAIISPSAAPGTTLTCTVRFLVGEESIYQQTVSLEVSAGRTVEFSIAADTAANASLLRAHGVYDCGDGEKLPVFVGATPDQVAGTVATFEENFDASLACGGVAGPATLTIVGTNGVQTTSFSAGSTAEVPVARKRPVAAIYQPTLDGVSPVFKPFPLVGHVTDPEDGDLARTWTITGPVPTIVVSGDVTDVPPPPGGWPDGDYTVVLSGTDSDLNTATATTTVRVRQYAFSGFASPIDNPPVVNAGKAGRTYPVKWSLTRAGGFVDDLNTVVAIRVASSGCGAATSDAIETTATGGTVLRYDSVANQFVYNWAAPDTPGCYTLTLSLDDGSTYTALFKLS